MFGKGDPILLFNGASDSMDAWDPAFLTPISSNHTVIVFDQRGIGNTTVGSKPYTYQQLANDSAGLLDALKIPKADVMGYSLGGHIAQAFTISYPEKVNSVIIVASTCGGKDGIPKPLEFQKLQADIVNKSLHNIPVTSELKALNEASLGSAKSGRKIDEGNAGIIPGDWGKVGTGWLAQPLEDRVARSGNWRQNSPVPLAGVATRHNANEGLGGEER
jgi:pimeloyl-ACP methyl ester carboxylesterase